jgi:DNA-binding CsgD family transcriptional regulator
MIRTKKQRESDTRKILALVAQGLTDKQIAARLHLHRKTVCRYLSAVRCKTGIKSRILLGFYALGKGIVSQEEIRKAIHRERLASGKHSRKMDTGSDIRAV